MTRALSGNSLSWAYVFEWPLFAGYVLYMRHRLARERAGDRAVAGGGAEPPAPADDAPRLEGDEQDEDEELAAYNRYLAALEDGGRRKHW